MDPTKLMSAFEVLSKKKTQSSKAQVQDAKPKKSKSLRQNNKLSNNALPVQVEKLKAKEAHPQHNKVVKKKKVKKGKKNKDINLKAKSDEVNGEKVAEGRKKKSSMKEPTLRDEKVELKNLPDDYNDFDTDEELHSNPIKDSEQIFEWIVYPLKKNEFFEKIWENKPLHLKRSKPKYFSTLMSTPLLDQILRDNFIFFTKNLDITSFSNDVRETHNPPGRALPSIVWDYFSNGCSVRMLNPQTYIPKLHTVNASLQELFGCFVGANSYLTPPNSQGFAPHYDDIEAFILQIEGRKRWRLYTPRNKNEAFPRYSSPNFSDKDLGEPILDTIVQAGDLLYLPRGTIHQGDTFGLEEHSLHVTLSVYQKNSWADYLEKLLPSALQRAIENDSRFRKGLPFNYLNYVGSVYKKNSKDEVRQQFVSKTKSLVKILMEEYLNIDDAVDKMAKNHIHDFLPPVLDDNEALCSVYEGAEKMIDSGIIINRVEIEPDTFVRLTRRHCVRLVFEESVHRLYYSTENSKEYHEYDLQFLEIDPEFIAAIQQLITTFPKFNRVDDLPIKDIDKKIQIIKDLWEKGIVLTQNPLPIIED